MIKDVFGVIIGNRGFFPDHLCNAGRKAILDLLGRQGIEAVIVPETVGKYGALESLADARACADLFDRNRHRITGVLVSLPNFGDERAVANALRWSGLNVPVLIHAFSDNAAQMTIAGRRDSFCGKMSVCNNLMQYGIRYSLTSKHTMDVKDPQFARDVSNFAAVCRVVGSLKNLRVGMIGARPAAFNTVRFSEKLLERSGISVQTVDLSEILARANKLKTRDAAVAAKLAALKNYTSVKGISGEGLDRMARLGAAMDFWMAENEIGATAIQCWTALEEIYGIVPCTLMSMMSETLVPSACETDITGLIGMCAMQAASGRPSALLDWNNNYGNDPDKCVLFHCSNLPKSFFTSHKMDYQAIIAGTVGKENAYGTTVGRIRPGPFTYCRVATDDAAGGISAYVGEGQFTKDTLKTFGGFGVAKIPDLQELLAHICENGYEHHVAVNLSSVAGAVNEALSRYLGWRVHFHR